jgi:hypothetical protein
VAAEAEWGAGTGKEHVADSNNHTIRKVVVATGLVTTPAGNAGNTDGTGPAARFSYPSDIASDGVGNLFVLDADDYPVEHHTLRRVVVATGTVTTLAGVPVYSISVDGTGAAARFCDLHGLPACSSAKTTNRTRVKTGRSPSSATKQWERREDSADPFRP